MRLASLLGFKRETPTRARLLDPTSSTFADATPEAKEAFSILETRFGPMTLKKQLAPLLAKFEKDEVSSVSNLSCPGCLVFSMILTKG